MSLRDDPSVRALSLLIAERERSSDQRDLSVAGLRKLLSSAIVGQERAINTVAAAAAVGLAGMHVRERGPVASLGLFGPTGCGKTELARQLVHFCARGQRTFIRLDMTEYSDSTALSRLVGSNRGYVGYGDREGLLTSRVRVSPDAVVIFDELEKAHPSVQDTLLQIFEEGSLTDGQGRIARFDRALVVLTSNLGSGGGSLRAAGFTATRSEAPATQVVEAVRSGLRPELVGRLDAIVAFDALSLDQLREIAVRQIDRWSRRAADRGWSVSVDGDLIDHLLLAIDLRDGARSLRSVIDRDLTCTLLEQPPGHYRAVLHRGVVSWTRAVGSVRDVTDAEPTSPNPSDLPAHEPPAED